MPTVLVASDADWVRDQVKAALVGPNFEVAEVSRGQDVRKAVAEMKPDLVIVDLQIGNMGGMAVCLDLRLEAGAGRLPEVPVLMLLDRRPDVFLARRAGADGWVLKPLEPLRLARATRTIIDGGTYEDPTGIPGITVPTPSPVL
jgi:DNA-binding response OmpR family regulator